MQNTIWHKLGLHDWFLKKENHKGDNKIIQITPNDVFTYIVQKFRDSINQLSFGNRIVFFHEYIISFSVDDYNDFVMSKKGIFGLIVHESIKQFYSDLNAFKTNGKLVEPSSAKWIFRFMSHPDFKKGDMSFIGKLNPGQLLQKEENLNVTFIPRQTGVAESFDVNYDLLKDFTFYSDGYYEVPFRNDFCIGVNETTVSSSTILARLETIIPDKAYAGKKLEYLMKNDEIFVTGNESYNCGGVDVFRIPSDWVDTPHLKIRYSKNESKFFITSFGTKTMLNEVEMLPSSTENIHWTELPVNSRIVINGIVGINIFR